MNSSKIIRMPQLIGRTGLSKSSLYALVKKGQLRPPIALGARAVGWLESDVQDYIDSCVVASRGDGRSA